MDKRSTARTTTERETSEFQEQVIHVARVARVVKGGRRFRFRALVAIGDGKNRVGVGIAKGGDVQIAVSKAVDSAKKRMIEIPTVNETIPHETTGKVGGGVVFLRPASQGTGVIAGGTVRAILDLTGIHNILSKSLGSTNKVNIAYATMDALQKLRPREEWITFTTADASKTTPKARPKRQPTPKPKKVEEK